MMLKQRACPVFNHVDDANPTVATDPPFTPYVWLNGQTGELITCVDNTQGANVWHGNLGTEIAP